MVMRRDQFPFCKNGCGKRCPALKRQYCSIKCHHDHDFRLRSKLLELGLYPVGVNPRFLRHYLVLKFGERCTRCGWSERHPKTGRVPVEVEHIDGDFRNIKADNLTLLCPNCHSLTRTFRGLNRGSGRRDPPGRPPKSVEDGDAQEYALNHFRSAVPAAEEARRNR